MREASPSLSLEPGQVKICVVDRKATRVTGGFARSRFVRETTLDATPGDVMRREVRDAYRTDLLISRLLIVRHRQRDADAACARIAIAAQRYRRLLPASSTYLSLAY